MGTSNETLFEAFLNQHDDYSWEYVIASLSPSIHEVDRDATRIWFHMFPLLLSRALKQAEEPSRLAVELCLDGNYRLENQIDSSHRFLYGNRYWPQVKGAVASHAESGIAPNSLELSTQIRDVARDVAQRIGVDVSLLTGITAIGFMTLQQVGFDAFRSTLGKEKSPAKQLRGSLRGSRARILRNRKNDKSSGLLDFLRGEARNYTVTFDESDPRSKFNLINTQHITTAAMNDKRPYHQLDTRCVVDEGPIPVQCRSAACGSCWIGLLGGAEKLSEVAPLERRRIRDFGYIDTDESRPLIRLACQAQAFGNVTLVIPPWNGVFGKLRRESQSAAEETSANPAR